MSQESQIVTGLTLTESTVLRVTPDRLWPYFRCMKFNELTPSKVASVDLIQGHPGQVDSTYRFRYTDGGEWQAHVLGVSDYHKSIIWEIVSAEPAAGFTSLITTLKIHRVTSDDTSFVTWQSDFSSDADFSVIAHTKQILHEKFAEMARTLAH
mmetsp:Transcript_16052/g.29418  ORF Transcript_16052/g.29418 Transcript_16052/m.29418 type:complete len:153 (+) Transcript_16052:204-662(+)